MNGSLIQDRVSRGLGTAGRVIGQIYDAFRPSTADDPVAPVTRYLRLPAAFSPIGQPFLTQPSYGRAVWSGLFDTAYTQTGDYLRGPIGTFFIAAQAAYQPALCVLTNQVLDVSRPAAPRVAGVNSYGGIVLSTATPLLRRWPASVLAAGAGPDGDLPAAGAPGSWTILLPAGPPLLRSADLIVDDAGRTFVVNTAERTTLGYRIDARVATP